ncbi:MAG: hypothetical protein H6865_04100 [Rhodospirillales bacterium]|nr:hypothetical protein [Rhodospirillales bacterium]USO08435.1 MAG: hypothetical protein H6866_04280 [Rhodospirillales bacterium]
MTQNAKKDEPQNPMAIWWKTLEQTQQMMQDNTRKTMLQILENQKRMAMLYFGSSQKED